MSNFRTWNVGMIAGMIAGMSNTELPMVEVSLRPDRCETCRFWAPEQPDGEIGALCKRYPPVLSDAVIRQEGKVDELDAKAMADCRVSWFQPRVDEDDWCGEWQAKPKPPKRRPPVVYPEA